MYWGENAAVSPLSKKGKACYCLLPCPLPQARDTLLSELNLGEFGWVEANTLSLRPAASILIATNKDGLAKGSW